MSGLAGGNGSRIAQAINSLIRSGNLTDDPVWSLTPHIDFTGEFEGGRTYRFEWEREWRLAGNLTFGENDPAFLVIPEENHERAATFFEQAREDNSRPVYSCPFIDANWDIARVRSTLGIANCGS